MPDMGMGIVRDDHIGRAADQADRLHAGFLSKTFTIAAIAFKE